MIEEIFITNEKNNVLYGDPSRYPLNPNYPVHVSKDLTLSQLKINDIKLGVLYKNSNEFVMNGYLNNLKLKLESIIKVITTKSILENYFLLFRILKKNDEIICLKKPSSLIPNILSNNAYIDVHERSNVIIANDTVVSNNVTGECKIKVSFNEKRSIKFDFTCLASKNDCVFKSNGSIKSENNNTKVIIKTDGSDQHVLKYTVFNPDTPLIFAKKTDDGYLIWCNEPTMFNYLEICIPISPMASQVFKTHFRGKSEYDEINNVLRWSFKDEVVNREQINLTVETFDTYIDNRSISVGYHIKDASKTQIKFEKAECIGAPSVQFWIKYTKINGKYEIRV